VDGERASEVVCLVSKTEAQFDGLLARGNEASSQSQQLLLPVETLK